MMNNELKVTGVPSSFVFNNMKLEKDAGSGESKLFIGPMKNEKEFDDFFEFGKGLSYKFDKDNLIEYLEQIKLEYVFQKINRYKKADESSWDEFNDEVRNLSKSDLSIDLTAFKDKSRYYVRADGDNTWKLFRKITVPKLTDVYFEKDTATKEITIFLKINYSYGKDRSDNKTRIPFHGNVRDLAKTIIDKFYRYDKLKLIEPYFKDLDSSIKIDTNAIGCNLKGNFLPQVFVKPASDNYDDSRRTSIETEYDVLGNTCRLSTQWENTAIENGPGSHNNLQALILVVNHVYAGHAKVINDDNDEKKKYIEIEHNDFRIYDTPFYEDDFARRFITSLLAKPFVILTGNSGTGKTRIAKQFATYLQEDSGDGEPNWVLVPVGADWTDNTKMLGFYNPLADSGKGRYEKTEILKLIERADKPENSNKPFFIILDEMNLSHVERYFADFLSHMETQDLPFVLDNYPETLKYPTNLFVIGTVNIDETTYMFSPKVLDRANVIEFNPTEDSVMSLFTEQVSGYEVEPAGNGMAESFMSLAVRIREGECEVSDDNLNDTRDKFDAVYKELKKYGFEFGYRTVKEIRQYISATYELSTLGDFNLENAEDEQLLQKVLPKIHGNKKEIGTLLDDLDEICENNDWKLSKEKIEQMKGKLDQVQYASFI